MDQRKIINTRAVEFGPYDMDGPLQEDISLLTLSWDAESRQGSYMMRMQPGAKTITHTHQRNEEYIILEGSLIEDDGTVLNPGDHVVYQAGTTHNSRTTEGCLLLAIDWQRTGESGGSG